MPISPVKNLFICLALTLSLAGCVDLDAEGSSGSTGSSGVGGGTGSGGGGSGGNSSTLRGSVGDGPVVNATITVLDNTGAQVATGNSDSNANYEIVVPAGTAYPITVVTNGGTDTVTNSAPTFSMSSVALNDGADIANITPFSTFIVENAKTLPGGVSAANINQATSNVISQLNFGLDTNLVPNPITSPVTDQNVAVMIKASEALGELIRRVQSALQNAGTSVTQNAIISGLSADLADGAIDGLGAGSDARIAATSNVVSAQVLIETLSNTLQVNGTSAISAMNNAITIVQPSATTSTADVLINAELITQAQIAVAAAQSIAPSQSLTDTAAALSSLSANSTASSVGAAIPSGAGSALSQAESSVATASSQELDNINETIRNNTGGNTAAPTITFSSNENSIDYNGNVVLSWSSDNATSCTAAGSWSGNKSTSDSETVGPFTSDVSFTLICSGAGGQATADVSVDVGEPPTPSPTVSINASPSSISYNGTTVVAWSSTNADTCSASGDWSGNKNASGSQTIGSLLSDKTFTLTCTGNGGSASHSVNVSVAPPPAPVVSLSASNTNVSNGGSTTLNWSSSNASSCSAAGDWSGSKAISGSQTISSLTADRSFTLNCSGVGGSASRTVVVTVEAPAPTVSLSASNTSVDYNGSTTLNWSSSNASACSATGDWSGNKSTSGSQTISSLTTDSSFTLTCTGSSGSAIRTVNVSVGAAPAPVVSLSINNTTVAYNGSATLSWSSSNATACSASGDWSGSKATNGSQTISSLTSDSTFTLTCSGTGGSDNKTVSVNVLPAMPTASLSASSTNVAYNGSTTLNWSSNHATSCTASGDWSGNKTTSGSQTINSLTSNSSFTITCTGDGGDISKTVDVTVAAAATPTVSLSASNTSVTSNGSTTLSWSSSNANSCTASGDWSGSKNTSGSQTINSITADSTFTLTCTGAGGSANQSINVTVVVTNGTALLSWTPPTTNTDGSSLTDLAGYKIYYGTSSGNYSQVHTINDTGISSYQIDSLSSGTWYFAVSAFDTSGNESVKSNEASKTIN